MLRANGAVEFPCGCKENIARPGKIRYNLHGNNNGWRCTNSNLLYRRPAENRGVQEGMEKINREDMLELTRRMTLKRNCFDRNAASFFPRLRTGAAIRAE